MNKNSKIYVAGHKGLVGSAITRQLYEKGYTNVITTNRDMLDLSDNVMTLEFFHKYKPEYVFLAAAKVGGILANSTYPVEFLLDNLKIQNNVLTASYITGVKKLLFLGSSCIYPRMSQQPIKEEYLLSGKLEPTNEPYAIAKIAGIVLCKSFNKQYGTNFIAVMPTNLLGINDNYDLNNSHVLPAMIRKFHEAKINKKGDVVIWGTGKPKREFLYGDDCADACIFLMNNYDDNEIINIGSGEEHTIDELANIVKKVIGFEGEIVYDKTKPDGMPRKLIDCTKIHSLGWQHKTPLEVGVRKSYDDFLLKSKG